jgi:hypothetical protein
LPRSVIGGRRCFTAIAVTAAAAAADGVADPLCSATDCIGSTAIAARHRTSDRRPSLPSVLIGRFRSAVPFSVVLSAPIPVAVAVPVPVPTPIPVALR